MDTLGEALLVAVVLTSCFTVSVCETCQCLVKHPQKSFCTADFVIIGKVTAVNAKYGKEKRSEYGHRFKEVTSITYKVKIKEILKINRTKIQHLNMKQSIQSTGSIQKCAIFLKKDKKYVMTGMIKGTKLWINSCDWVQMYDKLTRPQRLGLLKLYKNNCSCQINICLGSQCTKGDNQSCLMKMSFWSCYSRYGICVYKKKKDKTQCEWRQDKKLTDCYTV